MAHHGPGPWIFISSKVVLGAATGVTRHRRRIHEKSYGLYSEISVFWWWQRHRDVVAFKFPPYKIRLEISTRITPTTRLPRISHVSLSIS
ncbi:hypothetical protein LZ554_001926 [Drepanopeziza brunnea f. sp. 'monogermtubi']|nr:hypothetical protein LZ554_001926 [Drepanopeziza brunnea f. sp. 'monogermtubi']